MRTDREIIKGKEGIKMKAHRQQSLCKEKDWLTTWSQSQKGLGLFPINDNGHTVSYQIPIQNKGEKVRISLGNYYGETPVEIGGITVSTQKDIGFKKVTVSKAATCIIDAAATIKTDVIDLSVVAGDTLYLRIYYAEQDEANRTVSGSIFGIKPQRFELGNYTESDDYAIDSTFIDEFTNDPYAMKFAQEFGQAKERCTMTVQGVDVYTTTHAHTIVAFGDSITEQNHWVGPLQQKVRDEAKNQYSLVNAGISGNRLLKRIAMLPRRAQYFGLSGVERFEHDVFEVNANVSTVIVSLGVNDIHQPGTDVFFPIEELPMFEEMVAGFEKLIEIAHQHGSRIILATVSPFIGYAKDVKNEKKEKLRQDINTWIRQNDLSDGYYDFDSILADEANHSELVLKYDSGDKLHPSAKGGQAIVELINVDELLG
ncbi:MAG: GDSL-type esterase/lipase family protein [Lactococcus plantarum]|nr:GDSL-type esterase/lipase family protein [Lactococcus plantarum]